MSTSDFKVIDGTVRSVNEMFNARRYAIEYYQREYSWEKVNVEELILDFARSFLFEFDEVHEQIDVASYRPYFLGPVVTFSKDGIRYLVDGQQRMTSLSLLMIYISSQLDPNDSLHSQLKTLVFSTQFGKTQFTIDVPERESVMIAIRDGIGAAPEDLDLSSQTLWNRYQDISEIFPEELAGDVLPYFVNWLLHRVVLVEIGTTDKDMALEVFESMNDRGLRLSSMDMLKSYLLSQIGNPEDQARANKAWRVNVQELKDVVKNGDSDFMKTMLRAKYAETIRETKKSAGAKDFDEIATVFHKWVRDRSNALGLNKGSDFSQFIERDLTYYAKRYKQLLEAADELTQGLEHVYYNAHNDFTLQHMVILASCSVEDSDKEFIRKANLVAAYLDIMITRRMAEYKNFGYSPMYRPMFQLSKELRNLSLDEMRVILKQKLSEQRESIESLKILRLNKTNKPDIYYLLARITSWLDSNPTSEFFVKRKKDRYEVEHIWANKPERHLDEFNNEFEFADRRNSFGDLLLLPKSFNASFGALPYSEKVDKYFGQNILAQSLSSQTYQNQPNFLRKIKENNLSFKPFGGDEFTSQAISERQGLYVEMAKIIWSPEILDSI